MDSKNVEVIIPSVSTIIPSEIESEQLLNSMELKNEQYQACPICRSEVRLFFVNFNEKLLMCENTECDFPFGYEDLKFVSMTSEEDIKAELNDIISKRSIMTRSPTCTISEVDERSTVCDSELKSQCDMNSLKIDDKIKEDLAIAKNVEEIQKIQTMKKNKFASKTIIKNEELIKNLMKMQESSGIQLLDPSEIELVNNLKPEPQDIKISIRNDSGNMFSIDLTLDPAGKG